MKNTTKINAEKKTRVLHGYLCIHRSPRDPMLIHIVCNHFARAAGKLLRCECLFLMRFFNYLARAAATIFKYVCLFPIRERFHKCPLLLVTHDLIENSGKETKTINAKIRNFESRDRSFRGFSKLNESLATWNLLNTLAIVQKKNLTPTP